MINRKFAQVKKMLDFASYKHTFVFNNTFVSVYPEKVILSFVPSPFR